MDKHTKNDRDAFHMKKKFGQNFLIQPAIPARIADASRRAAGEEKAACLEIGPGAGALTTRLCTLYDRVIAVEVDTTLQPILTETLSPFDNIEIIWGDILTIDLATILEKTKGYSLSVCANLPYYITSPILMHLLESRIPFRSLTLMVQKEVAERLAAAPGSAAYSALTAVVGYYCRVQKLFDVSPGNFYPRPAVTSSVVSLIPHSTLPVNPVDSNLFFNVIRGAFSQRRKTLLNALSSSLSMSKDALLPLFEEASIDANRRGETLSNEEFCTLSNIIHAHRTLQSKEQ